MRRVRVALIEDHGVLSDAMRISLSSLGHDVDVIPLPDGPHEQPRLVADTVRCNPDVVLLDLDLGPAGDGAGLIRPLRKWGCQIIVLTGYWDDARWGECLAEGALSILSKGASLSDIDDTILLARQGTSAMPGDERDRLITVWRGQDEVRTDARARVDRLTRREVEVLSGLLSGRRVNEIAALGYVSPATVRTQVKSILSKLGVSSQIAAIAIAREAGLDGNGSTPSAALPAQRRPGTRRMV